ncbi:MAG: CrcB family protein [Actinomycetota bacterium]|nr:CrcB family protein [Actinomycetota bacterium]
MLKDVMWVGAGGAVGSALRYLVWRAVGTSGGFPWATVLVNVTGSFMLGLLAGVYAGRVGPTMRLAVFFGFLGGYTTFSTFTAETVVLARTGSASAAFGNVVVSVIVGLTAAFAGVLLGESLGSP